MLIGFALNPEPFLWLCVFITLGLICAGFIQLIVDALSRIREWVKFQFKSKTKGLVFPNQKIVILATYAFVVASLGFTLILKGF